MRIRHMTLPLEVDGDLVREPFVIIVDRINHTEALVMRARTEQIKRDTGARGVWIFADFHDVELEP